MQRTEHQLKGAAQMHFLCNSPFKDGILADGMGVGKTHTAIASMFLVKDEPGFSMVVAPKALCLQWVNATCQLIDLGRMISSNFFIFIHEFRI
jgi:SNF2 family DNA or RNA helicase